MATCCKTNWYPDRASLQRDTSDASDPSEDFSGDPVRKGIPCRVIDTGGDETFRGRQIEPHITAVVECRYFAGVLPTDRVLVTAGIHKDRILNIQHVKTIRERGKAPTLQLQCKENA